VAFEFSARLAFIKFIGTHAQHDRVSAATVSVNAIKFHMEQNGVRQKDLAAIFGSVSRASESLTGAVH
jgi:antitoxin component HigA of HigAB toxin-antitoxin module